MVPTLTRTTIALRTTPTYVTRLTKTTTPIITTKKAITATTKIVTTTKTSLPVKTKVRTTRTYPLTTTTLTSTPKTTTQTTKAVSITRTTTTIVTKRPSPIQEMTKYLIIAFGLVIVSATSTFMIIRSRYGQLVVRTTRGVADVYIDGRYVGKTPLKVKVKEGIHEVRLSAHGFKDYIKKVSIERKRVTEVIATLLPEIKCSLRSVELSKDVVRIESRVSGSAYVVNECEGELTIGLVPKIKVPTQEVSLGYVSLGSIGPKLSSNYNFKVTIPTWARTGVYGLEFILKARYGDVEEKVDRYEYPGKLYIVDKPEVALSRVIGHYVRIPSVKKGIKMLPNPITIEEYRIIGFICEGAFSGTFMALDEAGRPCVIKLPKDISLTIIMYGALEETVRIPKEFMREVEVLKKVSATGHPHIVKFFGVTKVVPGLAFEYCEGGSLADIVSIEGRLDLERSLVITIQIADALLSAYGVGLIAHRDLKPSNILFTRDGLTRVTDFNIAKVMGSISRGLSLAIIAKVRN